MPDSAQEKPFVETVNKVMTKHKNSPQSDNNDLLDAAYFAATLDHVIEELRAAMWSIRDARTEFESLTTESVLAPEYRKAYAQLADSLRCAEQAIQEINAAETLFIGHCKSVIATLREQDDSGLIGKSSDAHPLHTDASWQSGSLHH